ncbi:MAG TPA: HAD-IA family hydrolase [Candidatus Saccharimonadales bacterium]|nr:HAD-IA family hydrolase [Candidatus Saccharimonadales bacterium]
MITTLILDADGVLIHGNDFSERLVRDYDVDRDKEKEFFTTKFQECLVGKADLKESIAPYLASFGWKGTVEGLLEYWFAEEYELNKELIEYVGRLRTSGIHVVLATNQEKYRTQYMLDHMGFDGVFDKVYSSAHLGLKKPAVEFFAHLVEDMQVDKGEVLFWDDDQRNIDGATEYGIHAEFYDGYDTFLKSMSEKYNLPV